MKLIVHLQDQRGHVTNKMHSFALGVSSPLRHPLQSWNVQLVEYYPFLKPHLDYFSSGAVGILYLPVLVSHFNPVWSAYVGDFSHTQ